MSAKVDSQTIQADKSFYSRPHKPKKTSVGENTNVEYKLIFRKPEERAYA